MSLHFVNFLTSHLQQSVSQATFSTNIICVNLTNDIYSHHTDSVEIVTVGQFITLSHLINNKPDSTW